MPLHIIKDRVVKGFILNAGRELQTAVEECAKQETRTPVINPQVLWEEFSKKLRTLARDRAKVVIPNIDCEIQQIEADIKDKESSAAQSEESSTELMTLHARLDELTKKRHRKRREAAQARNSLEGEVISKY